MISIPTGQFAESQIYPLQTKIYNDGNQLKFQLILRKIKTLFENYFRALTKTVNFTKIIDDLWYRDISKLQPGYIDDFQVKLYQRWLLVLNQKYT